MNRSLLLLDNYDSFVHNLARYAEELGCSTHVVRSDAVSAAEVARLAPGAIILSPGPCTPREAGVCTEVVRTLGATIPMLGVCLGHQAIAAALGGAIVRAPQPVHGRTSPIFHDGSGVFDGLPSPLRGARYHSLIAEEASLPGELRVTARTQEGLIMGIAHRSWPVFGVQFHPESILTQFGHRLLANFLRRAGLDALPPPEGEYEEQAVANDFYARGVEAEVAPLPVRR